MKILIALEDLRIGGAQTFALRLAQALRIAGHEVHLYSHYAHLLNKELVRQLAPDVPVISHGDYSARWEWVLRKADGLCRRLGINSSLHERSVVNHLQELIRRLRPDVVNSHTIKADYAAALALKGTTIPLVITMHGCYELFLHKANARIVVDKGVYALKHAKAIVYLTSKNLEIFQQVGIRPLETILNRKIYNGFDGQVTKGLQHTRSALGIPFDAKVFGMVARGIPEKGWAHAVNSFLGLESAYPELHLVLVGESDFLMKLKAMHPHPRLHFTGFASNPIDWIDTFDVGLLPSYFHGESLPNSIAEYLSCGKPVIASRIGEVPAMLTSTEGLAGVLLEQANWRLTDPNQLTEAMHAYIIQPELLAEHKHRASLAFEKFRMKYCLIAYEELFQSAIQSRIA
ncbi:glycosyltransferase family 4 protein [Hymenobacter sp. BT770]|uniref:glycosyltransferase family 4 protein n=1 Tax=Hymenobacter sp. BT770 TaxID=2886942 RepID=UPI001D10ADF3|nr:glycosyltransferase family 4 protein [Hymenobacter sp. BT770]MCC3155067.1 glycosyltransferase family 4 protein [Hymenobacter sp. BT770]MDO3417011.1 glycosyltransferase family 4 protein [Hymenobacter sp. BT770]